MHHHNAGHLVNHHNHMGVAGSNTLHVVGVISNPSGWNSRIRLSREWMDHMKATPGVYVHLVEAAYGDRHHECDPDLDLRTKSEIWIKENMINLGVRHLLPRDWQYMAWVDADVFFRDPTWAQRTIHELQHYAVVQPWQQCMDLGNSGNVLQMHQSFGWVHQQGLPKQGAADGGRYATHAHSGFAWACTRNFWEQACGLVDFCILGSADYHMAWAMTGEVDSTVHTGLHPNYVRRLKEWEARVLKVTHGQVGYVHGRVEHQFHGSKKRRYYKERWQVLLEHAFDPDVDLMFDHQGLLQLCGKPELDHAILKYNRSRMEDSTDE